MIDIGTGVERELGISKEKMNQALYILQMEGYPVYGGGVPQVTNPGKQTNIKVLCPPGTEHKEIYNFEKFIRFEIMFLMMAEIPLINLYILRAWIPVG